MEDAGYRWSSKEDELLGRVLKEYVEIHFGDVENALQVLNSSPYLFDSLTADLLRREIEAPS